MTPKDWRGVRAAVDTMPPGNFGDPVKLLGTLAPGKALVSLVGSMGQPQATELCDVAAPEWKPYAPSNVDTATVAALFTTPSRTPAEVVVARPVKAAVGKPHAAADRAFWVGVGYVAMVILKTAVLVLGFGFLLLLHIAGTARR